jgi:hypothetical protein
MTTPHHHQKTNKHATVKIGDYTIPLIGIPTEATDETCQRCGHTMHLSEAQIDQDGKVVCKDCIMPQAGIPASPPEQNKL